MKHFISVLLLVFICSCKQDRSINYLHISHTRTNADPKMDSIAERIDYNKFNMLWLGGDLAKATSKNKKTMRYADSIFDFSSTNTLWSLGNHDYNNLKRIEKYTKRPSYYAYHKNDITFIILDTQDSLSNIIGEQKKLFKSVVDTIQNSSHLILLHHKLIWMSNNSELEPKIKKTSNGKQGSCFHCINPNNFYSEIYPELLKVQNKGIKVLCIAGDIGVKSKAFEYKTPDGIYLLASGIDYKDSNNKVLVFTHSIKSKQLSWEFVEISDL